MPEDDELLLEADELLCVCWRRSCDFLCLAADLAALRTLNYRDNSW